MPTRTPIRSLLALVLIVNLVVAGAPGAAMGHQPDATRPGAVAAGAPRPGADAAAVADAPRGVRTADEERDISVRGLRPLDRPLVARPVRTEPTEAIRVAWVTRATPAVPQPKAKSVSTTQSVSSGSGGSGSGSSSTRYKGRNHVWIPALGINRSVSFFSCSSLLLRGGATGWVASRLLVFPWPTPG